LHWGAGQAGEADSGGGGVSPWGQGKTPRPGDNPRGAGGAGLWGRGRPGRRSSCQGPCAVLMIEELGASPDRLGHHEQRAVSWFSEAPVLGSSELAEKRAHVVDEEVGCFHGGEVTAAVELAPVHDVVFALSDVPDRDVHGEYRDAGGNSGGLACLAPALGAFVVQAGGRSGGRGQPVQGDVGEQSVAVNGVLGEFGRGVG